jgi:hypothetical protein
MFASTKNLGSAAAVTKMNNTMREYVRGSGTHQEDGTDRKRSLSSNGCYG